MIAQLGHHCQFLNGGTPSKDNPHYFEGNTPWITSADITGPIANTARSFITDEAIQNSATNKVDKGTVLLVTRTGVGKVAIAGMNLCFSQDITAIKPEPSRLDTGYLVHFLRTKQEYFERLARGATIKGVTRDVVTDLEIPLLPLPEQRRIAAILDQADALRAKRREALAELDQLTQSIFIEMFGDPSEKATRFSTCRLNELVEGGFQNGAYFPKELYAEDGVEMVHMSDAFGGVIKRGGLKRVQCGSSDLEKYRLTADDLIIARRSLTYDGAARPCMVPQSVEPLIFESSFIRLRADKQRITPQFLFRYLDNNRVREKYVRPYVTQSTISGINQSNLAKIPVVVPPMTLQKQFDSRVDAIEGSVKKQRLASAELDSLFSSLQHRAFRGEL